MSTKNCDDIDPLPAADSSLEDPTIPPGSLGEDPALALTEPALKHSAPKMGDNLRYFGNYELVEEIARGGMGVVFKARQINLNRVVALKMILAGELAGEEEVKRFKSEAEAAAQLDHPGIVPIHEIGSIGGQHFYTMSFVDGPALSQFQSTGMKDPLAAARLVQQIAEAVEYAHLHGIVHRDLKPANVLLDEHAYPRITDFGLAKRTDSTGELTRTGQILGTPGYMAPEQAAGETKGIGAPADIYAVGGLLYFTLTGRPPFRAANVIDTLVQSLESEPTMPRSLNPEIPKPLEQICMRCLERDPADRYASAGEVAKDLDRFLQHQPVQARPPTPLERIRRFARRSPTFSVHLVALGLIFIVTQLRYVSSPDGDFSFHLQVSGLLVMWILLSVGLQLLGRSERSEHLSGTLLLCIDAALVTVLFGMMSNPDVPLGPLLIGYPLIIVSGAMFFHVRRVVLVTIASIVSYLALLVVEPSLRQPMHYHVCFLIMLLAIAACMVHLIRRVRMLSDYFETRR